MRVAIDLDNVVLGWQAHWAHLYNFWFDTNITDDQLDSWDACLDLTRFNSMNEFYAWFEVAGGWETLPYIPGAQGALLALEEAGIPYMFCTSRPIQAHQHTSTWAARQHKASVDFLNNASKHLAKASVWIDDSPEVIANLLAHDKQVIVFDQPWNRQVDKTVPRAHGWAEAVTLIKEML